MTIFICHYAQQTIEFYTNNMKTLYNDNPKMTQRKKIKVKLINTMQIIRKVFI